MRRWAKRGKPRAARRGRAVLALAGLVLLPTAGVPALAADSPERLLKDPRLTESSGLAVSGHHDGVLWTHNDSGDAPRLFAVSSDGTTAAVVRLRGASALDWEALAHHQAGARSWLYVGDIGDNARGRREIAVHRIEEPKRLVGQAVRPTTYRFRYPDGRHDAETLMVDPRNGRLYIVTKKRVRAGGGVYAAPARLSTNQVNLLTRVADAPRMVTDGDFLPDGRVALRDYTHLHVSDSLGATATTVALPRLRQAESLAPAPDGRSVLVGSEGRRSPVLQVSVPASE